jgi:hypothetical protein
VETPTFQSRAGASVRKNNATVASSFSKLISLLRGKINTKNHPWTAVNHSQSKTGTAKTRRVIQKAPMDEMDWNFATLEHFV